MAFLATSRKIPVDMTKVSGAQAKAWRYNPSNGQSTSIWNLPNYRCQELHAAPADADWLLVIDDALLAFGPRGT